MGWRERFREDNELLFKVFGHPWVVRGYVYIGVLTIAHQAMYRWDHCGGAVQCGLSYLKAGIWGLVWPLYWINYATDFVLLRPYG